jgi:hypothetical protein
VRSSEHQRGADVTAREKKRGLGFRLTESLAAPKPILIIAKAYGQAQFTPLQVTSGVYRALGGWASAMKTCTVRIHARYVRSFARKFEAFCEWRTRSAWSQASGRDKRHVKSSKSLVQPVPACAVSRRTQGGLLFPISRGMWSEP